MESLDKDSRNLDPESIIRFASTDLGDGPRASNDRRASEHVSSSTGVYDSTLSNYGIQDSNDHSRYKSGKRGETIARLLEISAHPPSFSSNRPRSYDVYIGFHGRKPLLLRFKNWIRGELGAHGLSCFVTDRARCRNSRKHGVARKAMDGSTFGVVILTRNSFKNPYTIEELNFFSSKRNLVPLYFDLSSRDCLVRDIIEKRGELWEKYGGTQWLHYGGIEKEWRDAIDALSSADDDWKLDANDGKWRDCILRAVALLASRLGRRSVVDRLTKWREKVEREEFPFPRNENFVGRKKELSELEFMLFGDVRGEGERNYFEIKARSRRKNSKGEASTGKSDAKEPVLWRESEKEIEMQNPGISQTRQVFTSEFKSIGGKHGRRKRSPKIVYGKGIACVSGEPGIGKTELLLEFAYRYHQRYKMVLWIGGESRYIRQNYLNLWSFLEIDVGIEGYAENGPTRSFEEREEAAVARVRKELMRNIPFLVIIDNLENEKDWWDHKLVMDLLPRFGGETHVIISTRLSRVMNIEPLKLSFLSGVEAMSLMQGGIRDQPITEFDVLRVIEERLGRLTLGLSIVGSILAELPINPSRLLDTVIRMPSSEITWSGRENNWLRRNTFLLQLFEVCFSIFDHADGRDSLASRMALASGWLGPGPIPIPILSLAARKMPEKSPRARLWRKVVRSLTCGFASSYARRSETEAVSLLVRFNMARGCTKDGLVQPNGLLSLYARARGGPRTARPAVQAVMARGSIHHHADHIWAACFLVLGFGKDPAVVELRAAELLFLVKEVIVPLAVRAFVTFSRCGPAVEVLRLCTEALEAADQVFVAGSAEKWLDGSLCWRPVKTGAEMNPGLWQELALGRAGVLEVRAKLMARGNQFDIGDDLIRKAIFIRTSICGEDHPDTVAARETLGKITRMASGVQSHLS